MLIMEMVTVVVKDFYVLSDKLLKKDGELNRNNLHLVFPLKKLTRKRNKSCHKLPLIVARCNGNSILQDSSYLKE